MLVPGDGGDFALATTFQLCREFDVPRDRGVSPGLGVWGEVRPSGGLPRAIAGGIWLAEMRFIPKKLSLSSSSGSVR